METCQGCGIILPQEQGPKHPYMKGSVSCWKGFGLLLEARLECQPPRPSMRERSALKWVVSSTNTSYRNELTVPQLVDALTTGAIEEEFYPQLAYIINEVSKPRQIQMIKEIAATRQINTTQVLKHFKQFAGKFGYPSSDWLHL